MNTTNKFSREHVTTHIHNKLNNNLYNYKLYKEYKNLNLKELYLSLNTNNFIENFDDDNFTVYNVLDYLNNKF